jgi:hypothetical protein
MQATVTALEAFIKAESLGEQRLMEPLPNNKIKMSSAAW